MRRALALAIGIASLALAGVALGGTIHCTGGPCTGSFGDDPMIGSDLKDEMHGLGGNDDMKGHDSDDLIDGGPGRDRLSEISDDTGNDTMLGGGGSDTRIEGGPGRDILRGGAGDERAGPEVARGLPVLPDWRLVEMFGDEGPDKIWGGGGDDSIEGEEGRDVMSGGGGNDYIDAVDDDTQAADVVRCGKGFDRFSARSEDTVDDNCEKRVPPTDTIGPSRGRPR